MDRVGIFHRIPRLAGIFAREVLRLLVNRGVLSPERGERILSWRHSGFNTHSRVRTRTKIEAGRVGKYMVRPVLGLDCLVLKNSSRPGLEIAPAFGISSLRTETCQAEFLLGRSR